MSHYRSVRMFKSQAITIAIVAAFPVGTFGPHSGTTTILRDYPSGAAATVSHNRPVRMSGCQVVTIAIAFAMALLVSTFALDGDAHTIR